MANDNEKIVELDLPLIENSDFLDMTNLLIISQDFDFEIFYKIMQEFINDEPIDSGRSDTYQIPCIL